MRRGEYRPLRIRCPVKNYELTKSDDNVNYDLRIIKASVLMSNYKGLLFFSIALLGVGALTTAFSDKSVRKYS